MTTEEFREEIGKAIESRLISIETLAWHHQYDWNKRSRIIKEHQGYLKEEILFLIDKAGFRRILLKEEKIAKP